MRQAFEINTIGPLFLAKAMLPLLKKASTTNAGLPMGTSKAAIVMISSGLGSITENSSGGLYAYRASKVALNMAMKNLHLELKNDNILVISMCPGWVQTDMGGQGASITPETCCSRMLKTFESLTQKDSGKFLNYKNSHISW